jgi:hypothetical protein
MAAPSLEATPNWAHQLRQLSTCSASFAGESENVPQGLSNGSALARVRLNTTNAWPSLYKFAAIAASHYAETNKTNFHSVSPSFRLP